MIAVSRRHLYPLLISSRAILFRCHYLEMCGNSATRACVCAQWCSAIFRKPCTARRLLSTGAVPDTASSSCGHHVIEDLFVFFFAQTYTPCDGTATHRKTTGSYDR